MNEHYKDEIYNMLSGIDDTEFIVQINTMTKRYLENQGKSLPVQDSKRKRDKWQI